MLCGSPYSHGAAPLPILSLTLRPSWRPLQEDYPPGMIPDRRSVGKAPEGDLSLEGQSPGAGAGGCIRDRRPIWPDGASAVHAGGVVPAFTQHTPSFADTPVSVPRAESQAGSCLYLPPVSTRHELAGQAGRLCRSVGCIGWR